MAKRIRAIEERHVTVYEDDGTTRTDSYSTRYLVEDADDPTLKKWVDVESPDRDDTRSVAAQRDQIEADARVAEGIARRA